MVGWEVGTGVELELELEEGCMLFKRRTEVARLSKVVAFSVVGEAESLRMRVVMSSY